MTRAMTRMIPRAFLMPVLAAALATPVQAQGLLDGLFGRQDRPPQGMQGEDVRRDMSAQIERLEQRVRQLTGDLEQAQYRNRQLEQQLQSAGIQPTPAPGGAMGGAPMQQGQTGLPGSQGGGQYGGGPAPGGAGRYDDLPRVIPAPGGYDGGDRRGNGRGDAFDPSRNPNAPGVPRALGSGVPGSNAAAPPASNQIGAPGGRDPGVPLDLSSLSGRSDRSHTGGGFQPGAGGLPAPPSQQFSSTGAVPTQPPSGSARDQYDLAYGYMMRKDYSLAEQAFQSFLEAHPQDQRSGLAQYWLGESLFQRQRYEEAAERFLEVSTKHAAIDKAPDSLLRLGQSLAAMKQTEMACAALAEVERKYPRASGNVKQAAGREQKRIRC